MEPKETAVVFGLGLGLLALLLLAATPLCVWIMSADGCERMTCEILIMRRPMSDVSYCERWFDLFR